MLEKSVKIKQVHINQYKIIHWDEVTEIIEDGKVISSRNHKSSATPIVTGKQIGRAHV